jgi:hypothetical protein
MIGEENRGHIFGCENKFLQRHFPVGKIDVSHH